MKHTTLNLKLGTLNLSRELRLALLAAMETCWVFAIIAFLAAQVDKPRPLSPLPFFIADCIALLIGRALPQSRRQWIVLQMLALIVAAFTVLAVAWAEFFSAFDWYDLAWLPRALVAILSITRGIVTEHLVTAGVLFLFIRGLGMAQRPLTLWFVGFQFRLGIVIFFLLLVIAAIARPFMLTRPYDPTMLIFVYFIVSLLAIALARIEEMGSEMPYGPRWVITILGGVALVLFIGLGILQFFNFDTARWLLLLLAPLWLVVAAITLLIMLPGGYLVGLFVDWARPLFEKIAQFFSGLESLVPKELAESLKDTTESPFWLNLEAIIKSLAVPVALMITMYFVARALHRRMTKLEEETYIREALSAEDTADPVRHGSMKKPRRPRTRAQHLAAESIRRIYAALVARAAHAGMPRRVAETPYEFLPRLVQQFPTQAEDLRAITEAYVAVHYGELDVAVEQISAIRHAWQRVDAATRAAIQPASSLTGQKPPHQSKAN